MHLMSLERISKSYPEMPVLENVSIGISSGERIGVIGRNGSGKSTLLRIIAAQEDRDSGGIVRARGLRISVLDQSPSFDPSSSAEQVLGGERRAIAIADRLGLTDPSAPVGTLSGGQQKRLALAVSLANDCDLLILDEPTNHLDVNAIDWLEDHLGTRKEALLLVTHDRYLLDRVVNRIIEIHDHSLSTHLGTYEQYLEAAAAREATEAATEHKRKRRIKTELEWLRRSPKARTSKSRSRVNQAQELMSREPNAVRQDLSIDLPSRRIGSKVVNLHNVGKRYGDRWVIRHVEHKLLPDARVGIVGPNGSGKTTLLKLIAQQLEPDEGKVSVGSTIHYGWYGQDPRPIPAGTRVQAAVREHIDEVRLESGIKVSGSQMLERFLFTRDQQQSTVGDLSGGERRRLELLFSLIEAPNLLLMDEPTNDLDIETLDVLEEYLDSWKGALVVSSHDRYFLDRVCTDLFSIEPDGSVLHHPGGWSNYHLNQDGRRVVAGEAEDAGATRTRPQQQRTKLTYNDKRDLDMLGREISTLERRTAMLTQSLDDAAGNYKKTLEASESLAATLDELDRAETRWLELTDRAEKYKMAQNQQE